MKKINVFCLLVALLFGTVACSRSAGDLMNDFRYEADAEYVHVPTWLTRLGMSVIPGNIASKLTGPMSVEVLDLGSCSSRVRRNFAKRVQRSSFDGYERLLETSTSGDKSVILFKTKGNAVTELLVISVDERDSAASMVRIKGKFDRSELDRLLNE